MSDHSGPEKYPICPASVVDIGISVSVLFGSKDFRRRLAKSKSFALNPGVDALAMFPEISYSLSFLTVKAARLKAK